MNKKDIPAKSTEELYAYQRKVGRHYSSMSLQEQEIYLAVFDELAERSFGVPSSGSTVRLLQKNNSRKEVKQ